MSRRTGPQCRMCRREGMKLFLKGTRCDTVKCSATRREYPPGQHTWRRGTPSEYGVHLREKQRLKRFFGMTEQQFRRFFGIASREKGNTGEHLLVLLERRVDNVIFLLGWGTSRRHARQVIGHGGILINGKKVDIPSYLIKPGDIITAKATEKMSRLLKSSLEINKGMDMAGWLERQEEPPQGRVLRMPTAEEASFPVDVQLVVELCSR